MILPSEILWSRGGSIARPSNGESQVPTPTLNGDGKLTQKNPSTSPALSSHAYQSSLSFHRSSFLANVLPIFVTCFLPCTTLFWTEVNKQQHHERVSFSCLCQKLNSQFQVSRTCRDMPILSTPTHSLSFKQAMKQEAAISKIMKHMHLHNCMQIHHKLRCFKKRICTDRVTSKNIKKRM